MKKLRATVLVLVASLFLSLALPGVAHAYDPPNDAVAKILSDTNAAREANGLAPLVLNESMTNVAQSWSAQQASEGSMYHNPNYSSQIPSGWTRAAENVAYGYEASTVVNGWMNSPGHKANILGDFNSIGIGVKDGYFTQVFAKYPNVTTPTTEPDPVVEPEPEPEPSVSEPTPSESSSPTESNGGNSDESKNSSASNSEGNSGEEKGTTNSNSEQEEIVEVTIEQTEATPSETPTPSANSTDEVTTLDALPEEANDSEPVDAQEMIEEEDSSRGWLLTGAIGSGVLLIGAVIALILLLRKK